MLDPREGRGELMLGLTPAEAVPGEAGGILRRGRDDEVDEDRDAGSELRSGAIVKEIRVGDSKESSFRELRYSLGHRMTGRLLSHTAGSSRDSNPSQTVSCLRH